MSAAFRSRSEVPRAARPWFRFYVEAMRDPKMRRLTPAQRWLWVSILAAARESCIPGYLMVAEGVPFGWADLADYAGMALKEVEQGTDAMQALGMIQFDSNIEAWFAPSFLERQYESDDVTLRTAKHRSKEQGRNVPTNDLGTGNSVSVSESVSNQEKQFDQFWGTFPRRTAKGAAKQAFARALKRTTFDVILAAAERFRDDPNRDDVMPHPSTWLNQDRWEDDPLPARNGIRRAPTGRDPNANEKNIRRIVNEAAAKGMPLRTVSELESGVAL